MSESLSLCRLVILFMLRKSSYPLTNTQISNFILDDGLYNYFTIQQSLQELEESGLVASEQTHSNTRYRITHDGEETLDYFKDKISDSIINDILIYFQKNNYEIRDDSQITAKYYRSSGGGYTADLSVTDGNRTLLGIRIGVKGESQAKAVCENWSAACEDAYAYLMDRLMK